MENFILCEGSGVLSRAEAIADHSRDRRPLFHAKTTEGDISTHAGRRRGSDRHVADGLNGIDDSILNPGSDVFARLLITPPAEEARGKTSDDRAGGAERRGGVSAARGGHNVKGPSYDKVEY